MPPKKESSLFQFEVTNLALLIKALEVFRPASVEKDSVGDSLELHFQNPEEIIFTGDLNKGSLAILVRVTQPLIRILEKKKFRPTKLYLSGVFFLNGLETFLKGATTSTAENEIHYFIKIYQDSFYLCSMNTMFHVLEEATIFQLSEREALSNTLTSSAAEKKLQSEEENDEEKTTNTNAEEAELTIWNEFQLQFKTKIAIHLHEITKRLSTKKEPESFIFKISSESESKGLLYCEFKEACNLNQYRRNIQIVDELSKFSSTPNTKLSVELQTAVLHRIKHVCNVLRTLSTNNTILGGKRQIAKKTSPKKKQKNQNNDASDDIFPIEEKEEKEEEEEKEAEEDEEHSPSMARGYITLHFPEFEQMPFKMKYSATASLGFKFKVFISPKLDTSNDF